ncbi:MAG TPA: diguanylate cyclase [Candidatus Choladousia intestinavium]|uniref:Diguanylate cyclase n=1 Tax=Candidatus Choladousia intestinavium TaxID=2840727 RepID=A0A9D1AA27_9FIRM|nr:diguanylate cyclase [Candidatus Choladousia intestinavium]
MSVKNLLTQFLDAYLVKRDLETALSFLSDDVISLGTGAQELALNKEELRNLMIQEFKNLPNGFHYEISEYCEKKYREDLYSTYCSVLTTMQDEDGINLSFQTRLTVTAAQKGADWKIITLHMSAPSDQQEGEEYFPVKYGRQAVGKLDASASRKLVDIMLSMLPGGIMGGYLEEGFPLYIINDTMLDYLGYTYDELVEETDEKMQKIIAPEDWDRVEKTIYDSLRETGGYNVQYRVIRKDGTRLWVDDKGHEIITEDGRRAMISIMLDINDSIQLQESLKREVMEDSLTGILNRKGAISHIEKHLASSQAGAMLLMDIDNFKQLNDTYGHQAGDQVLILLARIMQKYSRKGDVAARIGGDEFILFLPGFAQEELLKKRADDICRAFQIAGASYDKVALSVSIGIAISHEGSNFDQLFKQADDLLYSVKKRGKGTWTSTI